MPRRALSHHAKTFAPLSNRVFETKKYLVWTACSPPGVRHGKSENLRMLRIGIESGKRLSRYRLCWLKHAGFAWLFVLAGAVGMADERPAFLNPPEIVTTDPGPDHVMEARERQGIPSIAQGPEGRLWATWYAGPTEREDNTNYVVLATSDDDGESWSERLIVDPDGPDGTVRAFDPQIWVDPEERLWLFWAQATGHDGSIGGVWAVTTDTPDASWPDWSEPRRLTDGVMMNKPLVLSTGEWVLPVSTWRRTDNSARMVVSYDQGETWSVRGAAHVPEEKRNFDEHMIVERNDGSLWMLVRLTAHDGAPGARGGWPAEIGESVSTDRGVTWTEVERGDIPHVRSRFFITRLESGNLLLVKHADHATDRRDMAAYLSEDDGETWTGGLIFENRTCSYPDGFQAPDGRIYIVYDRLRTRGGHISMAVFTEADVAAGEIVSNEARLDVPISRMPIPEIRRDENQDGEALLSGTGADIDISDGEVDEIGRGAVLFSDRSYAWHEVPDVLRGKRFARMSIDGGTVNVTDEGVLFVATPLPNRNRDSLEASLLEQGFAKAALPEFLIFEHSSGSNNLCSLFQKEVEEGETIELGKWGIAIW